MNDTHDERGGDETPLARVQAFQRAANPNGDYHWPAEEAANVNGVPLYFDDIESLAAADNFDAVDAVVARWRKAEEQLAAVTARAEKAEAELRVDRLLPGERKPVTIGTGMPATTHLEAFGQCLRDAFGAMPYHVGSSIHGKSWRDVDVRIMLDDDRFDALFPGYADYRQRDAWWSLVCAAISELGKHRTGLPIDFQVQRTTEANEKFPGARNALFVGHAKDDHRPTYRGVACWPPIAAPKALSESVERSETSGGIGTASNSSTGTAGLSERCPCGCPKIGDGCNCRYCNEPYPTRQPNDDTTEDGQHG